MDNKTFHQGQDSLSYFGDIREQIHESWYPTFGSIRVSKELDDIARRLKKREDEGEMMYPDKKNIFRIFQLVPLYEVKCVIIAQDPYPMGDATGVAFSGGRKGIIPTSLKAIWKEVMRCYPKAKLVELKDPCIEGWCEQGVFLLNQCLTVTHGLPGSHGGIWSGVIGAVTRAIINEKKSAPWVLWGREAQRTNDLITKYGAKTLVGYHPAARGGLFQGNGHFLEVNKILEEDGEDLIDWTKPHPRSEE